MPSQSAASMNFFIEINGKVVQSTSSGFIPQLLILTQNPILPTGTVQQFTTASEVSAYFGNTSYDNSTEYQDALNAGFYFTASTKTQKKPSSVLFYRYVASNVGAYTRGSKLTAVGANNDLTALKLVTAGTLALIFNGTTYNVTGIDLSAQNSFSAMATALQTAIRLVSGLSTVTVEFDTTTNAFTITFPYDGTKANTVGYIVASSTGATNQLSQRMKITEASGAVLSQGLAAQTPAQVMTAITNLSSNFATYICNFDINSDPTYDIVNALTAWNDVQTYYYLPIFYDTNGGESSPITNPMQASLIANGWGQDSATPYTFNTTLMYIINTVDTIGLPFAVAGVLASYDFQAVNAIIQLNANGFAGITPIITNNSDLNLLINTFGANSYINLNTRANNFQWFEKGEIGGNYQWADTFVGYVWMADQIQVTLANLQQSLNSIPYNNLSIINSVINPIFVQGLRAGVVQNNIPISATQQQELIQQAGYDFTPILFNQGYYMPQIIPTAQDIATRTLSNINAWYTYAGGPVQITVNVTTVL